MEGKYTVERGMRGFWIIKGPDGQSVESVTSKAYAVERAAELTREGGSGWRISGFQKPIKPKT